MAVTVQPTKQLRIIDVFAGIGSFHLAANSLGMRCVFACDNDPHVKKAYYSHFGVMPEGDVQEIKPETIPDHDIMCAGCTSMFILILFVTNLILIKT